MTYVDASWTGLGLGGGRCRADGSDAMSSRFQPRATDILADETGPRRRRRPLWRSLTFQMFVSRRVVPVWLIIVLAVFGFVVAQIVQMKAAEDQAVPDARRESGSYVVGQRLEAAEKQQARGFGEPLYLGESGRPVIEVRGTGAIREMTELEVSLLDTGAEPVEWRAGVLMTAGPRGFGVWWRDQGSSELGRVGGGLDRITWYREETLLLQAALDDLAGLMILMDETDVEAWDRKWGLEVERSAWDMHQYYAGGSPRFWRFAPDRWSCDDQLGQRLYQGVVKECPGLEHQTSLRLLWGQVGLVVESIRMLGRVAQLPESDGFGYSLDEARFDLQGRFLDRIYRELGAIEKTRRALVEAGLREGNTILVDLPRR